ncbi:4-hydroxy-tetrahydrodipicolinate reductase [bacterium]|nr:4-hydroxy-tetrahydrodipicolinate reductase [bacterium]
MTRVIIAGVQGRMGEAIKKYVINKGVEFDGFDLITDSEKDSKTIDNFAFKAGDVIVDFSSIDGVLINSNIAKERKIPYLTGVTGLPQGTVEYLKKLSEEIPIFYDSNMSVGIHILSGLLKKLADEISDYDVEIVETHHIHKKDSPSGTALKLFDAINKNSNFTVKYGRHGFEPKKKDEITLHSIRLGGVFGEHQIRVGDQFEEISLSHRAFSRDVFAKGAVDAALWLVNQNNGFYTMSNFLENRI